MRAALKPGEELSCADRDIELKDGDLIILSPRGELTAGVSPGPQDDDLILFLQAAVKERQKLQSKEDDDPFGGN